MRDQQQGQLVLLPDLKDQLLDVFAGDGVQGGRCLVHQEQVRLQHQGPPDGHALALAAGERAGKLVGLIQNAQALQRPVGQGPAVGGRHAAGPERKGQVVAGCLPGQQAVVLQNETGSGAHAFQRLPVDGYPACSRLDQAGQGVKQRRLAAARCADNRTRGPAADLERHILQGGFVTIGDRDMRHRDHVSPKTSCRPAGRS